MARARARGALDRFEQEDIAFYDRVRAGYLSRAKALPAQYSIVDASQRLDAVRQDLSQLIDDWLSHDRDRPDGHLDLYCDATVVDTHAQWWRRAGDISWPCVSARRRGWRRGLTAGGFLAARHLCQQSDGEDPCGTCNSCRSFLQQAHGDFLRVTRQEGKVAIGIEQIRDATRFVQQTPLYGQSKVLLIEAAERMTLAAANSLLKTLEEPAGNTLILLASSGVWRLPATVRSRCQRVMIPRPTEDEALTWLSAQVACDASETLDRLTAAHGRPIVAWMAADATDVSLEATLSRSFEDMSNQQTLPSVWSSLPVETLLERLLVWIEAQARHSLSANHTGEGASWLTLHRCIAELSGRILLGRDAQPGYSDGRDVSALSE